MNSQELIEQRTLFARAVCRYIKRLVVASIDVYNDTHRDLRALYDLFGQRRVDEALASHWRRCKAAQPQGPALFCENWDSQYSHDPYPVIEIDTGKVYGQLQSTDWEAVEHSPGIQQWSKPF